MNLTTIIIFVVPIGVYLYPEYKNEQLLATLLGIVVTFLAPPVGCLRPHPYSDMPGNKPFAPRLKFTQTSIKQS